MNKLNFPKQPVLVTLVVEFQALVASVPVPGKFVHVAWAQNELAGYCGRLATKQGTYVFLEDIEQGILD